MKQVKWFERKFNFSYEQNIFPSLVERLEGTPLRVDHKISKIPQSFLTVRLDDKWSIQENIGHLINLEPLWQGRLEDILNREKYLRPTDLQNQQTDRAQYNERGIKELLAEFRNVRNQTLQKLMQLTDEEIYQSALHPRLETPMRTMDLFLFVAEHDDHHLARMSEINAFLAKNE